MSAIKALLNKSSDDIRTLDLSATTRFHAPPAMTNAHRYTDDNPRRKPKICKDSPVFLRGSTRGELRYPPFEYSDDTLVPGSDKTLKDFHDELHLYPRDSIGDYPRHIPYNSEKRVFLEKTGRDFFNVFQYQFRVPWDEEKNYTMLWDYNTGLVRTTPLFKCCGFGKTTPAKMLNKNVGLREICHSITGGALVAQGYWIPYEAAKAIAATFCYDIRYALTPVFGIEFIDLCLVPEDPGYKSMYIDESITEHCREQAEIYYQHELQSPTSRPSSSTNSRASSPRTPPMPLYKLGPASLRFKPTLTQVATEGDDTGGSTTCDSDFSEPDDQYNLSPSNTLSPASPRFRNVWSHVNGPRSAPRDALLDDEGHSPKSTMKCMPLPTLTPATKSAKRNYMQFEESDYNAGVRAGMQMQRQQMQLGSAFSSPAQSPKARCTGLQRTTARAMGLGVDEAYDADIDADVMDVDEPSGAQQTGALVGMGAPGKKMKFVAFEDFEAAKALMSLGDARKIVRRASA